MNKTVKDMVKLPQGDRDSRLSGRHVKPTEEVIQSW